MNMLNSDEQSDPLVVNLSEQNPVNYG
jgi:hypothetical protein